jgi:hypothetical protein
MGLTDLFTDNFWDEVESVTMGILDLLLPLINLLGNDLPDSAWPTLRQVHQGLHDIVAEAAWFTNGMRATRSVFWIQFPIPGEMNGISHEHAIDDIWNRSKTMADKYDNLKLIDWQNERANFVTDADKAEFEANQPRPFIRRTAKVQIAMWPFVKRYTPIRERDAGDGAYNSGETITQIMKAQTVYYYGDDADEGDMKERLTLIDHLKMRRRAKWWTFKSVFFYFFLIALLILFIIYPMFQRLLDQRDIKLFSQSYESPQEGGTLIIVPVPDGTGTARETIIIGGSGYEDEPSKSQHRSGSRVAKIITETMTRNFDRGQDDESSNNVDNDGDDDYDNEGGGSDYEDLGGDGDDTVDGTLDSSFLSKVESIAVDVASGADRTGSSVVAAGKEATASILSVMDQAGSTVRSAADRAGSKAVAGGMEATANILAATGQAGSIVVAGWKEATASILSATDQAGSTIRSAAGRAGSSMDSVRGEAGSTIKSAIDKAGSKVESVTDKAGSGKESATKEAGSSIESVTEGVSTKITAAEDDATASIESKEEDIVPDREQKTKVKTSSRRSTKATQDDDSPDSGSMAAGDSSSAGKRSHSGEATPESPPYGRSVVKDSWASSKSSSKGIDPIHGSTSSESRPTERGSERSGGSGGSTTSGRSAADESSTLSESEADTTRIASETDLEDIGLRMITVYDDEDGTTSFLGITTGSVTAPPKEDKNMPTTTITVPYGYDVVTVTASPTPDATAGSFKATINKLFDQSTRPP